MTETGKGLLSRHNACQERRQERHERHEVVTPASPDQEYEDEDQQREKNDLVGRQIYAFPLLMGRITRTAYHAGIDKLGVLLYYDCHRKSVGVLVVGTESAILQAMNRYRKVSVQ